MKALIFAGVRRLEPATVPDPALLEPGNAIVRVRAAHRLPLAEGPRAYDLFDRRAEGCTKVVLTPTGRAGG